MWPPSATDEDRDLLEQARALCGSAAPMEFTESALRTLATTKGIDLATTVLYDHFRGSSVHSTFIHGVETSEGGHPKDLAPRIIVMPGAFHVEHPGTGANGSRVMELAGALGWPAERIAVPSLAPMDDNAAALAEHLARRPGRPAVLVSLSKGSADVCAALKRPNAARELRDVRAWVSLSGIVSGTPLVEWLRLRRLRCLGVRLLLRLRGQRFAALDELRRGPGSPLAAPPMLPSGMRAIHVLAFPLVRYLSNDWARRGHARLSSLGPNDAGGILLADAVNLPGHVYPVWAADHYLRPAWDIQPLLLKVLLEAARPREDVPLASSVLAGPPAGPL
ncbi:MAG: hypothetical protein JWL69_4172 [Phycisphaerales bacterium]|nr:hypothetical protein [Phycisphaerales bacterium]MDB5355361.1 hypothetical protein [Phycisphaerales bacterium]